jgi:hypothetical protein
MFKTLYSVNKYFHFKFYKICFKNWHAAQKTEKESESEIMCDRMQMYNIKLKYVWVECSKAI